VRHTLQSEGDTSIVPAQGELGRSTVSVWVGPPAVDRRANEAALLMMAKWLGLGPSDVRLLSGASSRTKIAEVPDGVRLWT
jgi:uncharacterized protein YggU (UPF0235/DUF167 family)